VYYCSQVRRPLPLSVLLGVLLDAQILGVEMPQERLVRNILADFEAWQVRKWMEGVLQGGAGWFFMGFIVCLGRGGLVCNILADF
jgi:hypothetical protein